MAAGESARAEAARLRAEADRWDRGADGERRVGALLDNLTYDEARVLHDRLLDPPERTNLDHVVVCPGGVFLIDTKNWGGAVTLHEGTLWQHVPGRGSDIKMAQAAGVRHVARRLSATLGTAVTPVLCLAGERASRFGPPQDVAGTWVVGIDELLDWLRSRPVVLTAADVARVSVQASACYPPAVTSEPTSSELTVPPDWARTAMQSSTPTPSRRRSGTPRPHPHRPASTRRPLRLLLAVVVGLLLLGAGSAALRTLAQALTSATQHALTTPTPTPSATLSAARAQQLDDWRIRAGLYRDNDRPSALDYVADSALGSYADQCRVQRTKLEPFRRGLLRAPDAALAAAARRFDVATQQLLHACIANHPVALHHARSAMTVAASDVNTRFNRLLGKDPTRYDATRVL